MKISDNSLGAFINYFRNELNDIFSSHELEAHLHEVFHFLFGLKRSDLVLEKSKNFSESEVLKLFNVVKELKKGRPLAYVLHHKEFYGMDLYVDENTLIPRPETEELVDWILKNPSAQKSGIKILEIGTGSGCIPLALKKHLPEAEVTTVDISEAALEVAKKNARNLALEINFLNKNVFKDEIPETYDFMVSNPPYIAVEEKEYVESSVLKHEPSIAYFAENDHLIFYRRMMEMTEKKLTKDAWVYWEINQYFGKELIELLIEKEYRNIELRKDINNNDRMIRFQNR